MLLLTHLKLIMKKSTLKIPALTALVSLSLMTSYVFAENDKGNEVRHEDDKYHIETTMQTTHENNKEQNEVKHEDNRNKNETESGDGDNNGMNDQEELENESSLHEHFTHIPDVKVGVSVPQVDVTKVNTYADIVVLLNQYRDIINQIKGKGSIVDLASSTLSIQEKSLFSKIASKHSFLLSRTNVRADELLAQIKDLVDVLTPLGTQAISTELNLKNLLVSQLHDFALTINSLTDLVDTTSTIFDEETN